MIANYVPLQAPYGGPNYSALDPAALYELHIDNDGDAKEDLTFQFRFRNRLPNNGKGLTLDIGSEQGVAVPLKNIGMVSAQDIKNLNFNESYTLNVVRGDRRQGQSSPVTRASDGATELGKPYDFVGTKTFGSIAGYEQYAKTFIHEISVPGCAQTGRVFVGQRDESFVVNLGQIFDLINLVPVDADVPPDQGGLPGGIGIKQDDDHRPGGGSRRIVGAAGAARRRERRVRFVPRQCDRRVRPRGERRPAFSDRLHFYAGRGRRSERVRRTPAVSPMLLSAC